MAVSALLVQALHDVIYVTLFWSRLGRRSLVFVARHIEKSFDHEGH